MSKTHRCPQCPQRVEHEQADLCPSCGRCEDHCLEDNHAHLSAMTAAQIARHNA